MFPQVPITAQLSLAIEQPVRTVAVHNRQQLIVFEVSQALVEMGLAKKTEMGEQLTEAHVG
jgi:hypothetical protein